MEVHILPIYPNLSRYVECWYVICISTLHALGKLQSQKPFEWKKEEREDLFVSGVSLAAGENKWGPFLKSKQVNSQNLHSPSNFPNKYIL